MSGIDLGRRLSVGGSTLPVVVITAYDEESTQREARAVGCVDYMQKPCDASRLVDALERGRSARRKS
jgi:FixJ family two-component response regulator